MKEFKLDIEKDLRNGLQPEVGTERNAPYLTELLNGKPEKWGLTSPILPTSLVDLSAAGIIESFPFPQLFVGKEVALLASARSIYSLSSSWVPSLLTLYRPEAVSGNYVTTTPIGSGSWHFIDVGDTWLLMNGTSTIFKSGIPNLTPVPDYTFCENGVTITTGCYHRGRIVVGGFVASTLWKWAWKSFWESWLAGSGSNISRQKIYEIGQNFVFWSSIGGGDFPFWFFFPSYGQSGFLSSTYGASKPFIFEKMRENSFGFMPMEWSGKVLITKTMGKDILVFGENGISVLRLAQGIYGYETIDAFGIFSRSAVDGDDNGFLFLDVNMDLQFIEPSLKIARLGYREYMSKMAGDILIVYDSRKKEFYIGDGNYQFILTDAGLCRVSTRVTSVYNIGGTAQGIAW